VGVADGVEVGDLAVAVVVAVALAFGVVVALDVVALVVGVALVAGLGVAVFSVIVVTLDGVELATSMLDDGVALDVVAAGVADDVGAGVGVDETDALDTGVTTAI